jgi:hypothetical protein
MVGQITDGGLSMCRVVAVCGSVRNGKFIRLLDEIKLVEEWGVNDNPRPGKWDRVNLFGFEPVSGTPDAAHGCRAEAYAEHITISGLDLDELPSGTRLWVGDMAILEISGTEDAHHLKVQPHLIGNIDPQGLLARVVTGGMVSEGDQVVILSLGGKKSRVQ